MFYPDPVGSSKFTNTCISYQISRFSYLVRIFHATLFDRPSQVDIREPKKSVLPLLCPIEEYKWIPGWSCELIYSESGKNERDRIFTEELSCLKFAHSSCGRRSHLFQDRHSCQMLILLCGILNRFDFDFEQSLLMGEIQESGIQRKIFSINAFNEPGVQFRGFLLQDISVFDVFHIALENTENV